MGRTDSCRFDGSEVGWLDDLFRRADGFQWSTVWNDDEWRQQYRDYLQAYAADDRISALGNEYNLPLYGAGGPHRLDGRRSHRSNVRYCGRRLEAESGMRRGIYGFSPLGRQDAVDLTDTEG